MRCGVMVAAMTSAPARKFTVHKDGTISHWDCYEQRWQRCPAADIPDHVVASLSAPDRARVIKQLRAEAV